MTSPAGSFSSKPWTTVEKEQIFPRIPNQDTSIGGRPFGPTLECFDLQYHLLEYGAANLYSCSTRRELDGKELISVKWTQNEKPIEFDQIVLKHRKRDCGASRMSAVQLRTPYGVKYSYSQKY